MAKNYLKESFNADEGVMFTRGCKNIYEDKYSYNRHVMLMKVGQGFFVLAYVFTEEAKSTIEEEIQKTASQMVWFNDAPTISDQRENRDLEFTLGQMNATIQTPKAFITSDVYPNWKGNLLVGSLKFQYLNKCVIQNNKVIKQERLLDGIGRVRSVRQGPDGYIYVGVENVGIVKIISNK